MCHHSGGHLETEHWHSLLAEVRWTGPLIHVGGETMRVLGELQQLGNGFLHGFQFAQLKYPSDLHWAEPSILVLLLSSL